MPECPGSLPMGADFIPCNFDYRKAMDTDYGFSPMFSSELQKSSHYTSTHLERKTWERRSTFPLQRVFVFTMPVRHYRCQLVTL